MTISTRCRIRQSSASMSGILSVPAADRAGCRSRRRATRPCNISWIMSLVRQRDPLARRASRDHALGFDIATRAGSSEPSSASAIALDGAGYRRLVRFRHSAIGRDCRRAAARARAAGCCNSGDYAARSGQDRWCRRSPLQRRPRSRRGRLPLGTTAAMRLSSMKIVPLLMTSPSVVIVTIRPLRAHRFGLAAGLMGSLRRGW